MKEKYHIKHIEIYIVVFFVFLGLAVFAFVYGCQNINHKDPGVYEIIPDAKEEARTYGSAYNFYYYVDGSSQEITNKCKELTTFYSERLSLIYMQLDEEVTYKNVSSIAMINNSPNTEVNVGVVTYNILKDAYDKGENSLNYSVFAEPIYNFWHQSFSFLDEQSRIERDPINNEESASYLEQLTGYVNDRNHVDLQFLGNSTVKLVVSEEYQEFAKDARDSFLYVGLNLLKDSYIMKDVTSYFESIDLPNGFMTGNSGLVTKMKGFNNENYYPIYTYSEGKVLRIGQLNMNGPNNITNFRRFYAEGYEINNGYHFTKDGVTYYRSIYIDIHTGLPNNYYFVSSVTQNNGSVVDSTFINNELIAFTNIDDIKAYLASINSKAVMAIIIPQGEDKIIYASQSIDKYISLLEGLDYNLIKI